MPSVHDTIDTVIHNLRSESLVALFCSEVIDKDRDAVLVYTSLGHSL